MHLVRAAENKRALLFGELTAPQNCCQTFHGNAEALTGEENGKIMIREYVNGQTKPRPIGGALMRRLFDELSAVCRGTRLPKVRQQCDARCGNR